MSDSVEIRRLTSGGIVVGQALKGYDGLLTERPRGGGERNASGCE
jgi:nanoRNase/pAp phosphatase (c-di-AMP/oligoRNAs hydrolase)